MKMTAESALLDLPIQDQEILKAIWRKKGILLEEIEKLKRELKDVNKEIEQVEDSEESKSNSRAKQLAIGKKRFNSDPKKGMEYLIDNDIVTHDEKSIAEFLYKGEGLNKTAIGDYLGEKDEFHLKVLNEFVNLHKFSGLGLDKALRDFLWNFRLPGEAQKIDRMMEAFASRYCSCNPGVFLNTDTCYVLSFAIIMLNTSLHNPSVKEKPTVDRFISMNRGINDGKDLPDELLINLFDSIKKEPFKIPEDDDDDLTATFFNPDKEGWLLKQGGRYKTWKKRWFLLTDNCFYYFELPQDREPKGIIPLENLQIREVGDQKKPHCFELYLPEQGPTQMIKAAKTDSEGRLIQGKHTTYRMSASSAETKEAWIACIRKSVSKDPYYDMIAARKKKAGLSKSN
ncbi:cytohesin-1-like [Styela clava]|uniref:cytohesin-1-like n=1 Tax=Styela clava TaxID=7725 RepID=UPI00193AAB0C|nr:cytohesin-1-like [Styela clava]